MFVGTFTITIRVMGKSRHAERVDIVPVLVDTGAAHTMLPGDLLEYLGVEREWRQEFELGDLTRKQFDMGIATLGIEDVERQCPVMFGPEEEGLLGATTLEIFSLGVDPVHQQLAPITPRARAI